MLASIAGKTVIVTGASKGIGRGIARRFGREGLNVLVVSRHLDEARKVADEIGANASCFAADVSEAEPCQAMAAAALERYGSIDILCANAGIFPAAKLGDMTANTCYEAETRAFVNEANLWSMLFGKQGKPKPDAIEAQENTKMWAFVGNTHFADLVVRTTVSYIRQCGVD